MFFIGRPVSSRLFQPLPGFISLLPLELSHLSSLTQLIDEILDLSKIEAGKLELRDESINISDLIHNCTQLHAAAAQAKGLQVITRLSSELPNTLRGDPYRIRQIINNLLNNAIKFTRTGQVQLLASSNGQHWRCEVHDSGIGISSVQQALLFKPFSQVDDSSTRHHGGTGLGLSISKRLIEAMGGSIGVDSSPGQGSCFWFSLPLNPIVPRHGDSGSASDDSGQSPASDPHPSSLRVLVVEDHALNQKMILAMLDKLGASHHLVDNGLAALQALRQQDYDIVLMDCQMPIMDGYEAVRRIRAGEAGPVAARTRILALTANAMPEDVHRCEQAGFDMHVPKPVTLQTIRTALDNWTAPTGTAPLQV